MERQVPLNHVKGQTIDITGTITRFGRARDLVNNSDTLRFSICDEETREALVTADTTAGITINEDGEYRILIDGDSAPGEGDYWYELWLTEGGSGQEYRVKRASGPFIIEDSSR